MSTGISTSLAPTLMDVGADRRGVERAEADE
jgi:hypothetical protein